MNESNNETKVAETPKFVDRFDEIVLGLFAFAERGLLLLIGIGSVALLP